LSATTESDQTFKRICYRVGLKEEWEGAILEKIKKILLAA